MNLFMAGESLVYFLGGIKICFSLAISPIGIMVSFEELTHLWLICVCNFPIFFFF